MTTEQHEEGDGEATPASAPPGAAAREPSEVTVAKINRSSAITAAVITGVVTLSVGVITAVVTYNVGVQHGSQTAIGNRPTASSIAASSATPSSIPVQTQTTNLAAQPKPQSLIDMTPLSMYANEYTPGPEAIDGVTYQRTLNTGSSGYLCSDRLAFYQPARKYTHFHALVGLTDDSWSDAAVMFSIEVPDSGNDTVVGSTAVSGVGHPPQSIDANVSNAFRIILDVQGVNNSCPMAGAVWIDPTLTP